MGTNEEMYGIILYFFKCLSNVFTRILDIFLHPKESTNMPDFLGKLQSSLHQGAVGSDG